MPDKQSSFVIPDDHSIPVLESLVQESFTVKVQPDSVYHRVFYDTFDWRLYKNGSAFEVLDDGKSKQTYWRAQKDGRLKIQLGLRKVPRLAADLPASEFRQQLQSIISVRELSPRVKIRIKRHSLAVVDNNEKIVVRLYFDVYWYSTSRVHAARVLCKRLTIKAVKGYMEDYQQVVTFFAAMRLQPAQDNALKLALITSGVNTGEYSTRLNLRLDPEMTDEQALKEILLRLLEILQQNTSGTIKGKDTEFMHDYRVAIRKIRVALKQLNQLHPHDLTGEYKSFFSKLGQLTNPVRDLDVFLYQLENLQAELEEPVMQQLQPLCEYLMQARAEAQKKLVEELKSPQYQESIKHWRDYLEHSEAEETASAKPGKTVNKLADELLRDNNQQTVKQGKAVAADGEGEALHELRITFKKLRYLIEFFSSLYPVGRLRVLTETLTDVQDCLGKYHDRDIQIEMVNGFIQQSSDKQAIQASERLIKILEQQRQDAGDKFRDSYAAYASADSQGKFKEMFVDYHKGKIKL